jgi:LmbE family N-acetylglucosaminyl deacetylase
MDERPDTTTATDAPAPAPAPNEPGTVLAIWAHPDDEAYLAAGFLADAVDRGGRVVCAFATRGEAGIAQPSILTPPGAARLRSAEARAALAVLGVDEVRFLGHADGSCDEVDPAHGARQVQRLIEEVRPDTIVTFGSDGITGHPDHRAVSAWTLQAWARTVAPDTTPTLLLAAMTERFLVQHAEMHQRIGLFQYGPPRATTQDEVAHRVLLAGPTLERKRAALTAHASQTQGLADLVGEETFRTWWAEETFRSPTFHEVADALGALAA